MDEIKIKNPEDLMAALELVRGMIVSGTISAMPECNSGPEYWDVTKWSGEKGDWPDYFEIAYRDVESNRRVVFYCETYHGGGGALIYESEFVGRGNKKKHYAIVLLIVIIAIVAYLAFG
jgi:hypothetical protein